MIIEVLLIILLLIICTYFSVADMKYNIIKNKILLFSGIIGLLLDVIYYILYPYFFPVFILNFILLIICSILLYATHIWAAGDSKFLILVGLLIPARLILYDKGYYYTAIILIYAFTLSFAFLVAETIYRYLKKERKISLDFIKKEYVKYIQRLLVNCIYIMVILKLEEFVRRYYHFSLGALQVVINILLLAVISNVKFFHKKICVIGTLLVSIMFSLLSEIWIMNRNRLVYYFIVAIYMLIRIVINEYNYEEIRVEDLKEGMILSTYTTLLFINSRVQGLPKVSTEDLRSRLKYDEVVAIKKWQKSKYGKDMVQIVKKIPFAIFISLGTILYILVGVYLRCSLN